MPKINSINSHLHNKTSVQTQFVNTHRVKSSRSAFSAYGKIIQKSPVRKACDLYCTAEPGTEEWKEYQAKRIQSLKTLKQQNQLVTKVASQLKKQQQQSENTSGKREKSRPAPPDRPVIGTGKQGVDRNTQSMEDIRPQTQNATNIRPRSSAIRWREPIVDEIKRKSRSPSPAFRASKSLLKSMQKPGATEFNQIHHANSRFSEKMEQNAQFFSQDQRQAASQGRLKATKSNKKSFVKLAKGVGVAAENNSVKSLDGLIRQLKLYWTPPPIPDLSEPSKKVNRGKFTRESTTVRLDMNNRLSGFKKTLSEYGKGIQNISKDIEESYRKHRRSTLDEIAVAIRAPPNHISDDFRKRPILRQPLKSPITIFGGYLIRHTVIRPHGSDSKESSVALLHLTSFDRSGFQLEILLPSILTGTMLVAMNLAPLINQQTYFVDIDSQFNVLSIKLVISEKSEEEIQIRVPVGKNVATDLQVVHPKLGQPNGNRILVVGKL